MLWSQEMPAQPPSVITPSVLLHGVCVTVTRSAACESSPWAAMCLKLQGIIILPKSTCLPFTYDWVFACENPLPYLVAIDGPSKTNWESPFFWIPPWLLSACSANSAHPTMNFYNFLIVFTHFKSTIESFIIEYWSLLGLPPPHCWRSCGLNFMTCWSLMSST